MRKQDSPAHHITSFARYLNKVFDFRTLAGTLTDSRVVPEISPAAVFLATFHGFVFRLPSFQQMETELAQPLYSDGLARTGPSAMTCCDTAFPAFLCQGWKPCWCT